MALPNYVTVSITVQGSPVDMTAPEGTFVFSPNGTMWDGTPGDSPIVPSIQQGHLISGTGSVQLVASDNWSAGVLNWDVIINVRGMPTINFPTLPILYNIPSWNPAVGHVPGFYTYTATPNQSIWDILTTNGWSPVTQA